MTAQVRRKCFAAVGLFTAIVLLAAAPLQLRAAPYAAVVMDARSGEILHARNHDTRLHPASLTKMMTLYIAFEAVRDGEITLDTRVTVSRNAASEVCSCLGLRAGQQIALRYLIRAAAVRSGNDAATAIGEAISGSEAAFAERMTRTARAMGMHDTTFRNAHGLTHPQHLSTARDMTTLARQLYFDFPQYYNIFSRRTTHAGIAEVVNTNRRFLAAYDGADGIKTGYTRAAGFNLVGSAKRGSTRIIATLFGGNSVASRNARMAELLDMGFARAPAQVATRKPAPPNYGTDERPGDAGRIVRANLAVETSLRPRSQPVPGSAPDHGPTTPADASLVDLRGKVDALIETARSGETEPAADPTVDPEPRVAAPPMRPDTGIETDDTASGPDPESRAEIADAASEIVESVASSVTPEQTAADRAVAELRDAGDGTSHATGAREPASEPEPAALQLTSSAQPAPRPDEPVEVALAAHDGTAVERSREVVTRLQSDDGADWAIKVGRFNTLFAAERALTQTALTEVAVLDRAERRVDRSQAGFDATFAGLSREAADRACRRLQARDRDCEMVAP